MIVWLAEEENIGILLHVLKDYFYSMIQASYIHNAGSTLLHNSEQAFITVGC